MEVAGGSVSGSVLVLAVSQTKQVERISHHDVCTHQVTPFYVSLLDQHLRTYVGVLFSFSIYCSLPARIRLVPVVSLAYYLGT